MLFNWKNNYFIFALKQKKDIFLLNQLLKKYIHPISTNQINIINFICQRIFVNLIYAYHEIKKALKIITSYYI